jgi:hypothetical protein
LARDIAVKGAQSAHALAYGRWLHPENTESTARQAAYEVANLKARAIERPIIPTAPVIRIRVSKENSGALRAALSLYEFGRGQNHMGSFGVLSAASLAQAELDRTKLPSSGPGCQIHLRGRRCRV